YADEAYFSMFKYQWLAGSSQIALKDPNQVVLSESRARTYFSGLQPNEILGRSIVYGDSIEAVVSGVVKALEEVTDFTFKEFISRETIAASALKSQRSWDEWSSIDGHSQLFVKLAGEANVQQTESQLAELRNRYREREAN